jgi:golgi to ER traffic protein 4
MPLILFYIIKKSYLQNGNILAARTFINYFTAGVPSTLRLDDSVISVGEKDKVIMTKDSLLNFAQMAILTCQRAQGDQNKVMRESWVRLCGTYQGRVAQLATPEMRSVSIVFSLLRDQSLLIHLNVF